MFAMFLFKLLIVTLIISLIEARSSFQKLKNITLIEGDDDFFDCLKESNDYNPSSIEWSYGKDLKSLKTIIKGPTKGLTDYLLDRVSQDQAGFYICKFKGGKKPGWKKLFHLTVVGK